MACLTGHEMAASMPTPIAMDLAAAIMPDPICSTARETPFAVDSLMFRIRVIDRSMFRAEAEKASRKEIVIPSASVFIPLNRYELLLLVLLVLQLPLQPLDEPLSLLWRQVKDRIRRPVHPTIRQVKDVFPYLAGKKKLACV